MRYDVTVMPRAIHKLSNIAWCSQFVRAAKIILAAGLIFGAANKKSLAAGSPTLNVTNIQQLHDIFRSGRSVLAAVKLEAAVCTASQPEIGAVIVRDDTGSELLELGACAPPLQPGDKIRVTGSHCLLRQRETGVEISAAPVADNDGLHGVNLVSGKIWLNAGLHPLRLDWFNAILTSELKLSCDAAQVSWPEIPAANLWHRDPSGGTNYLPGLQVDCYEGYWENVPDFNWLNLARSGCVTNISNYFCTQHDNVGLRFTGFFLAPQDGEYNFHLTSDDGSLLFLGNVCPQVELLAHGPPPAPRVFSGGQMMNVAKDWVAAEGRIGFMFKTGRGMEFELRSGTGVVQVKVADALGLDLEKYLRASIRVIGLGRRVLTLDNKSVFGRILVASVNDLKILEVSPTNNSPLGLLTTAEEVQRLDPEKAARHLPVRLRGVVTSALQHYYRGLSLQDETRGIFVDLHSIKDSLAPASGELWEINGNTLPGDFAPIISAESIIPLGTGVLPEPVRPTWNQLINGSLDVQWVEIQGVITAVSSNQITLLLPEGNLQVSIDRQNETMLKSYLDSRVRIRGVLFAEWNPATHEVQTGKIDLRNASINVDRAPTADAFDIPLKTARELLRFDIRATTFQRVKIRGQVIHTDAQQIFLMDGRFGLRILPLENIPLQPGDLVEVVGYPEISGPAPVLREALIRKTGSAFLPPAPNLTESNILNANLDSTRVRIVGKLLGWHFEADSVTLDMQADSHLFVARWHQRGAGEIFLRTGSWLALTGVYVVHFNQRRPRNTVDGFELMLNSAADVVVLSQPSWWTLSRMLALAGVLFFILALASVWITQLRRQVEQRTTLLQREIREREHAERQRAIEAERSRIARDLHDDLGSSLTEIGVLASTGIRQLPVEEKLPGLFRSIGEKSRGLIAALDVIVWAVDPEQNTLQSLADYLGGFAEEYLTNAGISCRFKIPVTLPAVSLDGRMRHDLFLAIKEALHNIVQHSRATEVEFHLAAAESNLEILIADNGCGFVLRDGDGHGLKNLPARLTQMGGACEVISQAGKGTQVKISLNLPSAYAHGAKG